MERVILNGDVRRSEGSGGNIVILKAQHCHPERTIVILNEVKDLEYRSGLCTRFFADAQNDRGGY